MGVCVWETGMLNVTWERRGGGGEKGSSQNFVDADS